MNTIQVSDMVIDAHPDEWLHNRMYILTQKDKEVLLSKDEWPNDQSMDAAQKLICEEIGIPFTFQTVLNSQKKDVEPYRAVDEEHIQLLHDGRNHWILNTALTLSSRKAIRSLYKHYFSGDEEISFLPVQRQPDGYNCGLFATAFAAEILNGKAPSEAIFSVDEMRGHLISCLETQKLSPFLKASNV